MPIYGYRCDKGHNFEVLQRMSDDTLTACTTCGARVQRVFHPIAVHFKGSGFYNTDYGKQKLDKSTDGEAPGSSESSSSSDSGGSSDSSKSGSGSGDSSKSGSGSGDSSKSDSGSGDSSKSKRSDSSKTKAESASSTSAGSD